MKNGNKAGFWYAFNLSAIILIIFFIFGVPALFAFVQFAQSVDISAVQQEVTTPNTPTSFTVEIKNQSGTPLNAVEFELHYNPKEIHLTHIIPASTLCEDRFVISNTINNASGTALFQCGTVTPFKGSHGVIATVLAVPLTSGTSTISFATSTTHVLAHDGLGTDATRDIGDLVFISL